MDFRITPEKNSALWITILGIITAFGAAAIIGVLLIPLIGLDRAKWIVLIIGEAMIILPALLYVRAREYDFHKSFRLSRPPKGTMILVILITFSLQPLMYEFDRLLSDILPLPPFLEKLLDNAMESLIVDSVGSFLLLTLGAVFIAGISEEILFRGFLQKSFENAVSPIRAVLISSLVFSLVHLSPQLLQIFLLGILLGYIAFRTNSLYPSIVLHMINNAIAISALNWQLSASFYYSENHVSPLIVVPALIIFGVALRLFHTKTGSGAVD